MIVKHGLYSGLLLPQVPIEYGWNEKEFLEYTCEKAGLPKNYWKNSETEIQKFEGIDYSDNRKIERTNCAIGVGENGSVRLGVSG